MYTQQDMEGIRKRLTSYALRTLPALAALIAGYVIGMKKRLAVWTMVDGALIFAVFCFAWAMYLYPCLRYMWFLRDMNAGLSRELTGKVVEISRTEDYQDGVRVYPVRLFLEEIQDEHIVYLNVSKAEGFPEPGASVRLQCYGRHIKNVERI